MKENTMTVLGLIIKLMDFPHNAEVNMIDIYDLIETGNTSYIDVSEVTFNEKKNTITFV